MKRLIENPTSLWRRMDWHMSAALVALVMIGLVQLAALVPARTDGGVIFMKQLVLSAFGLVLYLICARIDYRALREQPTLLLLLYILGIAALVSVAIWGVSIRGSRRWFSVWQTLIAPTEFVKVILVLLFARFFSTRSVELYNPIHIATSLFYVAVPVGLVAWQPDLGSAMSLLAVWLGMVLVSGIRLRHFLAVSLFGLVVAVSAWMWLLHDYQRDRVKAFLNPTHDPLGATYNLRQAQAAVVHGGVWGVGLGLGTQGQLRYLPEAHSDFIFATIGEEQGMVGMVTVVALYVFLFLRLTRAALIGRDNFARLLPLGMMTVIAFHAAVNIGVNVGLLPITGIPLPFISAGGSSLLAFMIGLGLVQGVLVRHR